MGVKDAFENSYISIHAPTRGATKALRSTRCIDIFQSTLPRGERPDQGRLLIRTSEFQSTLPRGERRPADLGWYTDHNFNPRSHEGSDFFNNFCFLQIPISIHAPTRGATLF